MIGIDQYVAEIKALQDTMNKDINDPFDKWIISFELCSDFSGHIGADAARNRYTEHIGCVKDFDIEFDNAMTRMRERLGVNREIEQP